MLDLNRLDKKEFEFAFMKLSENIEKGKLLKGNALQSDIFSKALDRKEIPLIEVLENLRAILLKACQEGLNEKLKEQINTIRNLCEKIITIHPIKTDVVQRMPPKIPELICTYLWPVETKAVRLASTLWNSVVPRAQIRAINEGKLSLKTVFPGMSAHAIVGWLAANEARKFLEFADFDQLQGFDNDCLNKLTQNCPNLKQLTINNSEISGDALKYLQRTPDLQSLDIYGCWRLEGDALKHLLHTPHLQMLDVGLIDWLEEDALKHLKYIPDLKILNMYGLDLLEEDALKHLKHTPHLKYLEVYQNNLEEDASQHLQHLAHLQSRKIEKIE